MDNTALTNPYWQYLQRNGVTLSSLTTTQIADCLAQTRWDEPQSAQDFLNCAILSLVEAETCEECAMREMYLELAVEALNQAASHPIAPATLSVVCCLLGQSTLAMETAASTWLSLLQPAYVPEGTIAAGLVYLPSAWRDSIGGYTQLQAILEAGQAAQQGIGLLTEVLWRSQLVFYNSPGRRFLQLATQQFPDAIAINLRLGIAQLASGMWEGIFHLHRANQLFPNQPILLQALYLAYRDLGQAELAENWRQTAAAIAPSEPTAHWYWTELPITQTHTYVAFESVPLAVEPSFCSLVTSVLLAEADWFETEMEFWRDWLQPGMTVIDVGANVGVYTLSAACRVGATGRVLAIEPFSPCVACLEATVQVNKLAWVSIHAGAASDRNGTARLNLDTASELNALLPDDANLDPTAEPQSIETVACFTLDSLVKQENLSRIDMLKIDAEGHEVAVLTGSKQLLDTFAPIVMYENLAGTAGANLAVAEVLRDRGYRLHIYQPYLKRLIPVSDLTSLQKQLNLIALPPQPHEAAD